MILFQLVGAPSFTLVLSVAACRTESILLKRLAPHELKTDATGSGVSGGSASNKLLKDFVSEESFDDDDDDDDDDDEEDDDDDDEEEEEEEEDDDDDDDDDDDNDEDYDDDDDDDDDDIHVIIDRDTIYNNI